MADKNPDPIDDEDNPELTEADFARAVPVADIFPSHLESWKKRRGRPELESPKVHIGFRLAPDVVAGIRATGKGYNARVDKLLRDALAAGKL